MFYHNLIIQADVYNFNLNNFNLFNNYKNNSKLVDKIIKLLYHDYKINIYDEEN